MSDEERGDSLADQAAAWVPPWARPAPDPAPDDASVAEQEAPETDRGSGGPPEGPHPSKIAAAGSDLGTGAPSEGRDRTKISESGGTGDAGLIAGGGAGVGVGAGLAVESLAQVAVDAGVEPAVDRVAGAADAGGGVPQKRGRRRAAPEPPPAPVLDDAELRGALEAILLVVDQPVSELVLADVLEQAPERVGAMLDEIAAGYTAAGHGFELRRAAGGWRLYTRPEYATYVERFVLDGQSVRLTQAALETLAVVAYRQPVTRSRISAIRGVNCDGVLRTLVGRGLVEECGTEADSGAFLYRTTTMFLEKLGLNSVDDLPPLAPFLPDDVEELADATR
ncbi:SMC-Scp complex subunit ScpB [Micromonospora robiginosa]|uniref:SMC-Scp complex subunit ScpB n=1 Tax=Micromonospora robiginosa TaxID=2749844 RepID=A0A7L6B124_9ACTN|nr:SMC-Scp complex subunit ScpB [Micromonospora ferruginea]QLQ35320.1 SMC-Scp complex subunit ScpB [Micromonospora ferruginea]